MLISIQQYDYLENTEGAIDINISKNIKKKYVFVTTKKSYKIEKFVLILTFF